jgi:hypothetical protein
MSQTHRPADFSGPTLTCSAVAARWPVKSGNRRLNRLGPNAQAKRASLPGGSGLDGSRSPSFAGTPSPPSISEVALMSNRAEKHWKQITAPVVSFRGSPRPPMLSGGLVFISLQLRRRESDLV